MSPLAGPRTTTTGLAWTSDRSRAYALEPGHRIRAYEAGLGGLVPVGFLELPVLDPDCLAAAPCPSVLAVAPGDDRLVVVDPVGAALSLIDAVSGTSLTIPLCGRPASLEIGHDGRTAHVRDENGDVTVIDIHATTPRVVRHLRRA